MPAFQSLGRLLPTNDGEEEISVAFLERETFFVSARSLHFPHLPSSSFHLCLSLYFDHFSLSLSLFFIPLLTNLHILPFSCNVMHNPPFQFSSLSHLHPLVPFVGKSIPSIPSPRCPLHFKPPAFLRFSQLCYLPPPSSLRFLAG